MPERFFYESLQYVSYIPYVSEIIKASVPFMSAICVFFLIVVFGKKAMDFLHKI